MCKTRLHSQGMILNVFFLNIFQNRYVQLKTPPPSWKKNILNFHFDYLNPSLTTTPKSDYVIYVLPLNCWPQEMMISFRKPLCRVFHPHQPKHHQGVPSLLGEWASSSAIFITCNPLNYLLVLLGHILFHISHFVSWNIINWSNIFQPTTFHNLHHEVSYL